MVSKVITQTLDALTAPLAPFIARCIKFPQLQDEIRQRQAKFREIANFPGVVGAIDCCSQGTLSLPLYFHLPMT